MIDAVWTVGHHPSLCGTEKWGHLLAKKLGVPCVPIGQRSVRTHRVVCGVAVHVVRHPLVSVRASEVEGWPQSPSHRFDLFLHDWYSRDGRSLEWLVGAERVYAANQSIAHEVQDYRPDVIQVFAPATIAGNPTRGTLNVLTFGMAHKLSAHTKRYEKLKALLDDTPTDYTVSVSTAIHEGSPWDETARVADALRAIFGTHLRVLGYLADDALARELSTCSAVAVFYDPAVRANSTTFWAACESGRPVVTNLDSDSPVGVKCYDIDAMTDWPFTMVGCDVPDYYSWDTLTGILCAK